MALRLGYDDLRGVYAIMPTPATEDAGRADAKFTVDLAETARATDALITDGVDALMINGTFGEAMSLTDDEWCQFTKTVVDAAGARVPVLAGATTLDTRSTIERASFARDVGASGLLLGRPMWNELAPDQVFEFYKSVAEAVPELGIVIYNNPAAFKSDISVGLWQQLATIRQVIGGKYGMLDVTYREAAARVGKRIRLMPMEINWYTARCWHPTETVACWSGGASCDPLPVVRLRDTFLSDDLVEAEELTRRLTATYQTFFPPGGERVFRIYNVQVEKARMNAAGYLKAGPSRPPYHTMPDEFADGARTAGTRWRALADELRAKGPLTVKTRAG